ncbi:MAG: 30S ribosomal protein S6 [Alphaproteobacteria bacterium CG_4_10_14_0_2_um_filter_63_37]|nr:MAG: 30S ribosomal protein S6 [Proteobacteria bacterium CG1_02_64_396]PJA24613.1 MAG: 30S ribosomal protein S6 [Alphaproteobacteria bacterium CG_4_10_14_0_2_um_filter_63_37]
MSFYELTYLIKPEVDAEGRDAIKGIVADVVAANGGAIAKEENWGLREMAYPIAKINRAFYIHLVFETSGQAIAEIERRLRLNEQVLRFMHVQIDAIPEEASPLARPADVRPAPKASDEEVVEDDGDEDSDEDGED